MYIEPKKDLIDHFTPYFAIAALPVTIYCFAAAALVVPETSKQKINLTSYIIFSKGGATIEAGGGGDMHPYLFSNFSVLRV